LEADDSKLSPHVGQKVEITGELEGASASASTPSSSASSSAGASASAQQRLKVDSVRMVSASCTP
jgi:hypothetical protein